MDITLEKIKILYEFAKKVYEKQVTKNEALVDLQRESLNKDSAGYFIDCYECFLDGKMFKRTINIEGTKYFLDKIYEEKGIVYLSNALKSLTLHIDYFEDISDSNVIGKKQLLQEYKKKYDALDSYFTEEIDEDERLSEGLTKTITVNVYERNPLARKRCIEHYGAKCIICDFDFEEKYGKIGKGFIHVHHLVDIATIGKEYEVDYVKDLIPVCPNCHAMLHKKKPAYSIEEMKMLINLN